MKIRTQNLLAIVPLFLLLAAVSSILMYWTESQELMWGLREETTSLAVSTAEFVDGNAFASLVTAGTKSPYFARLHVPLERILRRGEAKRIFGLSPDGSRVVFSLSAADTQSKGEAGEGAGSTAGSGSDHPGPASSVPAQSKTVTERGETYLAPGVMGLAYAVVKPDEAGRPKPGSDAERNAPIPTREVATDARAILSPAHDAEYLFFVTEIQQMDPNRARMTAVAPIRDPTGRRVGLLGVDTDAGGFLNMTRILRVRGGEITGIVLLLGAAAALLISGLITREVEDLSQAAVEVKEGNLDRQIQAGRIQEIGDLSNTFNTMSDVLRDVLSKTKRSLIEGEQFRTEAELAQAYTERFWPPLDVKLGEIQVVARQVGRRPMGAFYSAFATAEGACVLVGRIREAQGLDAAIEASAASALLRQQLAKRPAEGAIEQVAGLFALETLTCVCWNPSGERVRQWTLASPAGGSVASDVDLPPGTPIALHTFGVEAQATIARYLEYFPNLPLGELLGDTATALPGDTNGSLLLLRRDQGMNL